MYNTMNRAQKYGTCLKKKKPEIKVKGGHCFCSNIAASFPSKKAPVPFEGHHGHVICFTKTGATVTLLGRNFKSQQVVLKIPFSLSVFQTWCLCQPEALIGIQSKESPINLKACLTTEIF